MVEKVREELRMSSGRLARNALISVHMAVALLESTGAGTDLSLPIAEGEAVITTNSTADGRAGPKRLTVMVALPVERVY